MSSPSLHIFDKVNYTQHRVVDLPKKDPTPLTPSSLRVQTRLTTLSTNNLTYARNGHIFGWWDAYPVPSEIPAPYNDTEKYCGVCGWGYLEVVESSVPEISPGRTLYGFVPISTATYDLSIKQTGLKDQIFVTSPHRQHLWEVYNRYQVCGPLAELEAAKGKDSLGWDGTQALWGTSYNISKLGFAWEDKYRVESLGLGDWTAEDSSLDNAVVIVLNASGKTAMGLAYALRFTRPKDVQPRLVVGVGSQASQSTISASGFYDKTVLNEDSEDVVKELEQLGPRRFFLFEFGSRPGAKDRWSAALKASSVPFTFVGAGGEVKPMHPDDSKKYMKERMTPGLKMVNASALREKGIAVGGDEYLEEFYEAWETFKKNGGIPGVIMKWREGVKDWEEDWTALCKDQVVAAAGLGSVYRF